VIGVALGSSVGTKDGSALGSWLGDTLGALVGDADGLQLGTALGIQDGFRPSLTAVGILLPVVALFDFYLIQSCIAILMTYIVNMIVQLFFY